MKKQKIEINSKLPEEEFQKYESDQFYWNISWNSLFL